MTDRDPTCLFCRILSGDVPAKVLHRDERTVAVADVNPKAPFHALVIPVRHVATLADLDEGDAPLAGEIVLRAIRLAREHGLDDGGFRLVWNAGADAGQSVFHIHLHVLGGRRMGWPPG